MTGNNWSGSFWNSNTWNNDAWNQRRTNALNPTQTNYTAGDLWKSLQPQPNYGTTYNFDNPYPQNYNYGTEINNLKSAVSRTYNPYSGQARPTTYSPYQFTDENDYNTKLNQMKEHIASRYGSAWDDVWNSLGVMPGSSYSLRNRPSLTSDSGLLQYYLAGLF